MRQHEVIIGQALPQMLLSPGQIFGAAQDRACKPTMALATRPGVTFNKTGVDRLTDCGGRSARWHRRFRTEDDLRGDFSHVSPCPALDDLGIGQGRRGEARGCGLGPTFARDGQENLWYPLHLP